MWAKILLCSSYRVRHPPKIVSSLIASSFRRHRSWSLVCFSRPYSSDSYGFSSEYEMKLCEVVSKDPARVAQYIRESMQKSRRRIIHFRNSVTHVTIVLQSRLHAKTISISDASVVVEELLKECVFLKQADMAHLLFRAALRFSQMGSIVRPSFLVYLYQAYRGNKAVEGILKSIAEELRNSKFSPEERKILTFVACILSGDKSCSLECLNLEYLTCDVATVLLESLSLVKRNSDMVALLERVVSIESQANDDGNLSKASLNNLFSTTARNSKEHPEILKQVQQLGKLHNISFSDSAASIFLLVELNHCATFQEVEKMEKKVLCELQVTEPPLISSTISILRCCDLALGASRMDNEAYLRRKIDYLHEYFLQHRVLDKEIMGERETTICVSIIRGYGVLQNYIEMGKFLQVAELHVLPNQHKLYEEVLRWFSVGRQATEAIKVKEKMNEKHIYHTVHTYQYLFNVLDTSHFSQLIEKYYREMRYKGIRLDGFITAVLLRVFAQMDDWTRVESLYAEAKAQALTGNSNSYSPRMVIQMLKNYSRTNPQRCSDVIADAEKFNCISDENVQAECIAHFLANHDDKEMERFLSKHTFRTPQIHRVLLKNASRKKNRKEFDEILRVVEKRDEWDERMVVVVIAALSYFSDAAGVKKYVALAEKKNIICTSIFFSDVASAFSRLGNPEEVHECWEKMLASKLVITMPVYNRFLDLYMSCNNVVKVQEVLDTMMRLMPPTTETVTSIIKTLGKMGRLEEMEAVLASMSTSLSASPTLSTLHSVMSAYAKVGNVRMMESIREKIAQHGFSETTATYVLLIEGYGRAKRFERIHKLLEEQQAAGISMDESGYLLLLSIFSREHLGPDIEALVKEMITRGVHFSNKLLAFIAVAFASINNTVEMEKYVATLLSHPDCSPRDLEMVYSIYAKRRDTVKVQELLDNPSFERTRAIYNTCIAAFAKAGEYNKVAYLLAEMDKKHFTLSKTTSIVLSSLLVKAGKMELAQAVLNGAKEEKVLSISQVSDQSSTLDGDNNSSSR